MLIFVNFYNTDKIKPFHMIHSSREPFIGKMLSTVDSTTCNIPLGTVDFKINVFCMIRVNKQTRQSNTLLLNHISSCHHSIPE